MKKVTLSLAAIALVGLYAGTASAQCNFNIGATAKGVSGSMVRNMAPCTGTEHPVVNTSTEGGTDACTPVIPQEVAGNATPYTFNAKGKCSAKTSAKLLKDCSAATGSDGLPLGLQAVPCHITYVSAKCSGIENAGTPIGSTDDGWSLATLTRASLEDSGGPMTVIDFPVTFDFSTPDGGKISLSSSSAEALKPLVGPNNADLPACTSLEIVDLTIKDGTGLPFAKLGSSTAPKL